MKPRVGWLTVFKRNCTVKSYRSLWVVLTNYAYPIIISHMIRSPPLFKLLVFLWVVSLSHIPVLAYNGHGTLRLSSHGPSKNYCLTPLQRREWRTLNDVEKTNYITAVKCTQSRPALHSNRASVRTRFDEFQALHIDVADRVHATGQFLPWHRRFLRIYEEVLRGECGYNGAIPYWDWTQDADESRPLLEAAVFDSATGFGGNGVPGTYTLPPDPDGTSKFYSPESFVGCVQDGPFASYVVRMGPGKLVTDHCLVRGVDDTYKRYLTSTEVAKITSLRTFEEFHIDLEGRPVTVDHKIHDGGHDAVGGEMSNFYSSPADPLFYLHHANLDRIWWIWQQMLPSRLYDISGRSTITPPFQNVTLDFGLEMGDLAPTIPIRDVMDLRQKPSCYAYV
ncbi:Di-copper centre-containing protein [Phlegmacium glaucopus]|nr:Di-copper centre-containing protein [Phlegmacium glaucopus]